MNDTIFGLDSLTFILIVVIAAAILLLAILFIVLEVTVFSRMRIKKQYNELNKNYKYLNSLLTIQDSQYLSRLEQISQTNLLYIDVYEEYLARYNEIKDEKDANVADLLNALAVYVEDKNVKGFKKIYNENYHYFNEFEKAVTDLNIDLEVVIRPEEDCRKDSLMLKDKYREVKALYMEKHEEILTVEEQFDKIFSNIDKRFNKFEDFVDTAQYDEAKELLPSLAKVLTELKKILEVLPNYLNEVNDFVPKEMGKVLDKYNALVLSELPLRHLNVEDEMEHIKNVLVALRSDFKNLKVNGAGEKIEALHAILAKLDNDMDLEEDARNKFNNLYQDVMISYTLLEKDIIKLNNSIDNFEKYYIIDDVNQQKRIALKEELDTLSKFKRRVDFYVHGLEKTYYTDLLNKINDLKTGIDDCKNHYDEYSAYLASLKTDTDKAYELINSRYLKMKKCEAILREFNNETLETKYAEEINNVYTLLDEISVVIKSLPIDVIRLNELCGYLEEKSIKIFTEVDSLNSYRILSIDNITLINRDRMKFADVHNLLTQAESLFFDGEYKSSYDMSETIINRIEDKDKVSR